MIHFLSISLNSMGCYVIQLKVSFIDLIDIVRVNILWVLIIIGSFKRADIFIGDITFTMII
jgi:hypothetical protein